METLGKKRLENGLLALSKRLREIAGMVSGKRLIDIGTDHGLLPIFLLEQETVKRAVGVDCSALALQQARVNRERSFMGENLKILHSNGLKEVHLKEGDSVVLAGMGGGLMTQILAPAQLGHCHQIIIQPNKDLPMIREFLSKRGWKIAQETIIKYQKKLYVTIAWKRGVQTLSGKEIHLGLKFLERRPAFWCHWIEGECRRLLKIEEHRKGKLEPEQKQLLTWLLEETELR